MELLQLKYFQTVAELQHITNAAKILNISQPSLSIMISRLEEELGTPLFTRRGRNIELNKIGEIFLKHVNNIFNEIEDSKNEIKDALASNLKSISIVTSNTRILRGILRDFLYAHPEITVHQYFNTMEEMKNDLLKGEIDFCIGTPPIYHPQISFTILREDEIVLVVPLNHRLAKNDEINLSDAENEDFIALANGYSYRKLTDDLCLSAGFTPKVIFEVDDALMYEILMLERGICLVPLSVTKAYINEPYKVLKLKDVNASMKIVLCWNKEKYMSSACENFKKFMIKNF